MFAETRDSYSKIPHLRNLAEGIILRVYVS